MSQRGSSVLKATAALMEVVARARLIEAATIRGAAGAEVEVLRREAHDLLDAYLDHSTASAVHVRQIIDR